MPGPIQTPLVHQTPHPPQPARLTETGAFRPGPHKAPNAPPNHGSSAVPTIIPPKPSAPFAVVRSPNAQMEPAEAPTLDEETVRACTGEAFDAAAFAAAPVAHPRLAAAVGLLPGVVNALGWAVPEQWPLSGCALYMLNGLCPNTLPPAVRDKQRAARCAVRGFRTVALAT